jgi:hypothetical protein
VEDGGGEERYTRMVDGIIWEELEVVSGSMENRKWTRWHKYRVNKICRNKS